MYAYDLCLFFFWESAFIVHNVRQHVCTKSLVRPTGWRGCGTHTHTYISEKCLGRVW